MKAINRIKQYIDNQGYNNSSFEKEIGLSNGYIATQLKRNADLGEGVLNKMLDYCLELNPEWLLTGKGEMLKSNIPVTIHEYNGRIPRGAKPFYNLPVSAGRSLSEIVGTTAPEGFIFNLPGMAQTENILPVIGYSMYPEVKENAVIGVRVMDRWETLNTTKKYLIITREDRMIKYIEHDEHDDDILWCVSPNYPKFKIYKEEVIEIQQVTFVLNPE
ncbi:MAG: hypothetical protein Q4G08_04035 [Capnocytophaga sp.]|nr:hypothetical protein [Capnocytophaga sp.]